MTNGANATLFGKAGLNLGAINITGNLEAISTAGNVTNSGQLVIPGWVVVGAGTAVAPGNINLDFTAAAGSGNKITGTIYLQDDINLTLKTALPVGAGIAVGNYLANNVTVMNENAITLGAITNTYGTGIGGNLTLTGNGVTLGNTIIGGAANLTSINNITATGTNKIATFNINDTSTTAGLAVSVKSSGATTVNATLNGPSGSGSTATFASGGTLTLGTISSNYDGLVTFDSSAGGNITDSTIGGLQVYGPATFTSKGDITVNKGGNNFGGVTLTTQGDNNVTYSESGTVKLVSVGTDKAAASKNATISITSENGSIIETGAAVIANNGSTTAGLTLVANKGDITLNSNAAGVSFMGPVSFTTGTGNASYSSNVNTILGNTTVSNGTLSVDVTNTANSKLTQASGTSAYVYGALILKALGTGDITLGNNGNRFGGYQISNATGNITMVEDATANLQAIATGGNLSITSNYGSIIDSANSSLAAGFTNSIVASNAAKVATFNAKGAAGSINLSLANDSFVGSVALNTTGNASVLNKTANTLTLGQSTVGGTLTAINNGTGQNIAQSGPLNVTGDVTFTTTGGVGSNITLTNSNNLFGGIRFYAGSLGASITEAATLNLKGGSVSTGPVVFSTAGNFITSGPGGSSITSSLSITANGTIIPGANSLLVTGTFTVYAIGLTDLSALSKSGNLANHDPVNIGPGAYTPPSL
jgi:hypothetical protein